MSIVIHLIIFVMWMGGEAASGDGKTAGTAWKTIQEAANTIKAGDTVYVKGGITYSTTSCGTGVVCPANSGTTANPITYTSWPTFGIPTVDATGKSGGFYS